MRVLTGAPSTGRFHSRLHILMLVLTALLLAFFLGSVIFGAWLNFSPVPTGDRWLGMVAFYMDLENGPLAWWVQHNEHRIFFSKLLFWLDMRFFQGSGLLLIPANIALLLLTWWMLAVYAGKLIVYPSSRARVLVVGALGMLCLAWMQRQNIISSFQSMFIMAFLVPLLSFYCYARALESGVSALRWKILALFFGVASVHCMANGVFVLPLLAVLSGLGERRPRWVLIILACSVLSYAVFMLGYQRSVAAPWGIAMLQTQPWTVIKFALAYLGGPFYVIFNRIELAVIAGGVAVALTLYLLLRRSRFQSNPYALALLAGIGYIFAAAGMTAVGRAIFPLPFAASSRYLTPALIMWAALLILLLARTRHVARWSAIAVIAIAALLVPAQTDAFDVDLIMYTPQIKAVGALSLQMGIDDQGAKKRLSNMYGPAVEQIYQRARARKLAIFSEKYAYPANQVGQPLQAAGAEACSGQINFHVLVDQSRSAYKVGGMLAPAAANKYRYILFGDAHGAVKGIAIPGRDVRGESGPEGPLNFDGYMFEQPDFVEMRCGR